MNLVTQVTMVIEVKQTGQTRLSKRKTPTVQIHRGADEEVVDVVLGFGADVDEAAAVAGSLAAIDHSVSSSKMFCATVSVNMM